MKNITDFNGRTHRLWWVPLITGIIAIIFSAWCFLSPATSLSVFAYIFAIGIIVAGFLNLFYACFNTRLHSNWGWSLALGLLEILCGGWLLTLPADTLAVTFAYAVGIWILFAAINAICEAAYFSRYSRAWTVWMILLLVATIFFGFYFLADPLFGGVAGWLWVGCSLLLFGIWRIALALKIRDINHAVKQN